MLIETTLSSSYATLQKSIGENDNIFVILMTQLYESTFHFIFHTAIVKIP
jgi:hypothetical protein